VPGSGVESVREALISKLGNERTAEETPRQPIPDTTMWNKSGRSAQVEEMSLGSFTEQAVKLSHWVGHVAHRVAETVSRVLDSLLRAGGRAPGPGDDPLFPSEVHVPAAPPPTAPSPAGWFYIAGGFFMIGHGTSFAGYETLLLQPALLALFSVFLIKGGRHIWTFSELAPNSLPRLPDERPG
jgi:hypothetical protein